MTHFATEAWADYLNGFGDDLMRDRMAAHLTDGCAHCRELVAYLEEVGSVVRADATDEVPEDVLRGANALFDITAPTRSLVAILAQLVFDSLREPLPAGVRTQHAAARRLIFQAAHTRIDLRVEGGGPAGATTLTGQLTQRESGDPVAAAVSVHRVVNPEEMARADTNEFGEFLMEFHPTSVRIHIVPVVDHPPIDLLLDTLDTGGPIAR